MYISTRAQVTIRVNNINDTIPPPKKVGEHTSAMRRRWVAAVLLGKVEASKDDCAQEKLARHQTLTLHHESQLPTLPLAQWGQIIFEIVFTIF